MLNPSATVVGAAGALPRHVKDNAYVLGDHGFIYTAQHAVSAETVRHPGVLLLSADRAPFEITLRDGRCFRTTALAIGPRVARRLKAEDTALISINILPSSHWFHVLRPLRDHDGVVMLDREAFTHLDTDLWQLHRGDGNLGLAHRVFDEAMAEVRRQLPARPEPHPDVLEMVRQLDTSPHLSIEELAAALGRTSQWVSRTFSTELDMSMRDYQNWLKQRREIDLLYTRRSLTQVALESGFGDSPQFSRTFLRWYGRSPSYSRNPHHVRVFIEREPDGMKLVCFRQPAATTNPAS